MSGLVFLAGAPTTALVAWTKELAARPQVVLARWNFGATLDRLREATEHRATVWQGVHASKPRWAALATERFAPELTARLLERLGRPAQLFGVIHFDNGPRVATLAAAFPEAKFLHVVRDGAVPVAKGAAAAPTWASFVEPLVRVEAQLGERLITVRDEDARRDPDAELARVLDALGLEGQRRWSTGYPGEEPRLEGEALQVFLAHGPARRLLKHFGYPAPEPDESVELEPHGAALWATQLVADGRLDEADALLARVALNGATASLAEALGDLRARQGREADAALGYVRAIQLDANHVAAWLKLFALPRRPETEKLAASARSSPHVEVRRALSRWLVARGLDPEAAQIVAAVEHR